MEMLRESSLKVEGEPVVESYQDVSTRRDVALLWIKAISFVGGKPPIRDDLRIALQNVWGTIGNGINFSIESPKDSDDFIIKFQRGRKEATVVLNEQFSTAEIIKRDLNGIAA